MSNRRITESVVEEAALSWFEELGYAVLSGPDIAPSEMFSERESYDDVILEGRLRSALTGIIRAYRHQASMLEVFCR